jgi:hypothetical protein
MRCGQFVDLASLEYPAVLLATSSARTTAEFLWPSAFAVGTCPISANLSRIPFDLSVITKLELPYNVALHYAICSEIKL